MVLATWVEMEHQTLMDRTRKVKVPCNWVGSLGRVLAKQSRWAAEQKVEREMVVIEADRMRFHGET